MKNVHIVTGRYDTNYSSSRHARPAERRRARPRAADVPRAGPDSVAMTAGGSVAAFGLAHRAMSCQPIGRRWHRSGARALSADVSSLARSPREYDDEDGGEGFPHGKGIYPQFPRRRDR